MQQVSKRQLFLRHVAQTSPEPLALEIERAEGLYMYSPDGKRYLDLIAGISVSSVGHRHPDVVAAIKEQSERYLHTLVYGEFVLSPQVQLAEWLAKHLPDPLDSCYFVNSGAEATEGALKLAKRVTGRREIISCKQSYHGSTHGAMSLMSDAYFTSPYRPLLPQVHHISYNCEFCLQRITEETACVIVETVRAEVGVERPRADYLKKLRQRCDAVGALLIFDEIQVGCGRTGSFWAFEQYGVVPDILLLAKALGGGMPIGVFISSRENMQHFTSNPILGHITTFGGHPVACAAALATLKVLKKEPWVKEVPQKAQLFRELLQHPKIKAIRNAGLLMAMQLSSFEEVQTVIKHGLERGVVSDWFLFNSSAVRIAPPLGIDEAAIRFACEVLLEGLDLLD